MKILDDISVLEEKQEYLDETLAESIISLMHAANIHRL